MLSQLIAKVRGLVADNRDEGNEDARVYVDNRGDLIVVQALPPRAELARLGRSWQAITTTGQAALTALPTTTSGLSLNNNEKAGGATYVVDSFGSVEEVVDATQTDVTAIFAMINKTTSAQASGGTAETTQRSFNGRPNYGGTGTLLRGATVVNDTWFPHGTPGAQMAAVAAGANWKVNECFCEGLYQIPPGGAFSIQAVKAAAAAAAQQFFFVRWHEAQIVSNLGS